jgi:hypothetical protein
VSSFSASIGLAVAARLGDAPCDVVVFLLLFLEPFVRDDPVFLFRRI